MTGTDSTADDAELPPRSATIRSRVPHADTVAAAVSPDDTDDVETRAADGVVRTAVERPTTSSLQATVDDAVVALDVATAVAAIAEAAAAPDDRDDTSSGPRNDGTHSDAQHDDHATDEGARHAPSDTDNT